MAVFSVQQFLREQWRTLPPFGVVDNVTSKTVMVTGSNVGLGFEASVHLTKMEPKWLLATCRDETKCERARKAIIERAEAGSMNVTAWPLDLASFESVRAFADRFAIQGSGASRLDALVANAGLFCPEYARTPDGWDLMLQVNYLSTALLSVLLLPHLVNASQVSGDASRLVIVSSSGHYLGSSSVANSDAWTNILDTINAPHFPSGPARYNVTKLLQVIFVRELTARLPDLTPVVVCTVDPGFCVSRLFRAVEDTWYTGWIMPVLRTLFCARSTEEGSRTLVHAAVAGEGRTMHGRYLSSCQVTEEDDFLFTPKGQTFAAKVWDETLLVLSRVDERVPEIVDKYLRATA
ncbi:short-chain dehydrogenase [Chiua virens]|nr:short-chain dehydrogenase [Chiua virens]